MFKKAQMLLFIEPRVNALSYIYLFTGIPFKLKETNVKNLNFVAGMTEGFYRRRIPNR